MRLGFFLILFLLDFTAYFSDPTDASQAGTDTPMESEFQTARALRIEQVTTNAMDEASAKENEERLSFKLGKLFQRSSKSVTAIQKNPAVMKQVERLDSNPTIRKGIQSIKETPQMLEKVKSLGKIPNFVKSLQKSPSVKTVRQVDTYLSKEKGGAIGLRHLLDKLGVGK